MSVYKKYKTSFTISFPGKGNGIRGDIPEATAGIKVRSAPNDGYEEEIVRWKGWLGEGPREESNCDKQRCYTFRIRVEYDKQGNIKSALYGKIYDDFDLSSLDGVRFLYYLNPTPNDRNLEWDMKNNLCPKPGDIGNPRP